MMSPPTPAFFSATSASGEVSKAFFELLIFSITMSCDRPACTIVMTSPLVSGFSLAAASWELVRRTTASSRAAARLRRWFRERCGRGGMGPSSLGNATENQTNPPHGHLSWGSFFNARKVDREVLSEQRRLGSVRKLEPQRQRQRVLAIGIGAGVQDVLKVGLQGQVLADLQEPGELEGRLGAGHREGVLALPVEEVGAVAGEGDGEAQLVAGERWQEPGEGQA